MKNRLLPTLHSYFEALDTNFISSKRCKELDKLIDYARNQLDNSEAVILNFVCTHNSRRSQISQIMATVAACYYNVNAVCYSGGTEETAFHPNAISSCARAGLEVISKGEVNPVVFVRYSASFAPLSCFSKVYDHSYNKSSDFAAVMTCAHADDNCPVILNATRIPIRYEDPKRSDGTDLMEATYDNTVNLIALEMKYVFLNLVK